MWVWPTPFLPMPSYPSPASYSFLVGVASRPIPSKAAFLVQAAVQEQVVVQASRRDGATGTAAPQDSRVILGQPLTVEHLRDQQTEARQQFLADKSILDG